MIHSRLLQQRKWANQWQRVFPRQRLNLIVEVNQQPFFVACLNEAVGVTVKTRKEGFTLQLMLDIFSQWLNFTIVEELR